MYDTKTMEMEILASLLLFLAGIAALVVIHLCIVGRVFRGALNGDGKIPGRISNQELKNLPSFNYSSRQEESSSANGDCVVCLDMFKEGDKCRKLPNCNHSFHVECIDYWLLKTAVCPICRTRVCPSNVFTNQNSDSGSVAIDIT